MERFPKLFLTLSTIVPTTIDAAVPGEKPVPLKAWSDPPYTYPLFPLCRVFGVLPVRLFGRQPTVLYSCLLVLPLSVLLVAAKVIEVLTEGKAMSDTSVHVIMIGLYTIVGLPDLIAALAHLRCLWTNGESIEQKFGMFRLKRFPILYPRFLSPIGIIFFFFTLAAVHFLFDLDVMVTLTSMFFNFTSYFILMLFCSYLELVKEEMSEVLPLEAASAFTSVLVQMDLTKKAVWAATFFSDQLLFLSIRVGFNVTLKIYNLIYAIKAVDFPRGLVVLCSISWEFYLLAVMTGSCNSILRKVEEFDRELYTVIRKRPDLFYEEKMALYINRRPKLFFSASGFFDIGYPLVTSIIAVSLSYTVILVQFSK